jgi:hypothetical protein
MRAYDEDDPLNPSRGCIYALIIGVLGLIVVAVSIYLGFQG